MQEGQRLRTNESIAVEVARRHPPVCVSRQRAAGEIPAERFHARNLSSLIDLTVKESKMCNICGQDASEARSK
jgi:hypothetical protein